MKHSQLLMMHEDLPHEVVLALDRVQKGLEISHPGNSRLRKGKLIEGRGAVFGLVQQQRWLLIGRLTIFVKLRRMMLTMFDLLLISSLSAVAHLEKRSLSCSGSIFQNR